MPEADRQLFRISTTITVGNGHRAKFQHDYWLDPRAPKDLAPNLFKLAWRKNRTVSDGLENMSWTRGLWKMSTIQDMAGCIQPVTLLTTFLTDQSDDITW